MKPQIFTKAITVLPSAIDARNHVNNLTYLEWCLDAAETHWESEAPLAMKENYVWYVLEHTITYKAPAFEGEELNVETWVTNAEGAKSERHYTIFRPKDQKLLVEAKTLWCLLDAHSQKPTKITNEIRNLFLKPEE